ncbi:DNA-deoxyinosine glycosylase [Herbaspirillum sp. RTI4]|uniref:DNA-deoxyinosine glycosylase n=1 Tax=Herbaspirillum sp. RTI4 TaxID=3048640 RepID=UPI002AB55A35|nr:DNA-deoxyinosine glycosylase [Herbaspirillum sp. RTI4]MDY7579739.1 DNA-deoxyinosine glycosylase [Herbaspirillum sp. RTI4]MEA9982713.1 DNA-deoxyinosine glycosylase [Herbaspirillum sp. RTI4]
MTHVDATTAQRKRSFAPVVNEQVRTLILGSLPGERSLAQSEYYAHPQNKFWKLLSVIIDTDLTALAYADKLQTLLAHGIGLWDVVAEAQRQGSLDSHIRHHVGNELTGLIRTLPRLKTIAFNGGTAEKLGIKALQEDALHYRIVRLPSSSPAHTLAYALKLEQWQRLLNEKRKETENEQEK